MEVTCTNITNTCHVSCDITTIVPKSCITKKATQPNLNAIYKSKMLWYVDTCFIQLKIGVRGISTYKLLMILLEWNELFIFFYGQSRKIHVSLKNIPRYFKQGKNLSLLIRFNLIIYQSVIKLIIIYLPVESIPYSCLLINFLHNQMTQCTRKLGKHHKPCSRSGLLVSYQRTKWGHGKYYGLWSMPKNIF